MGFVVTPYAIVQWCSALVSATVAAHAWPRRRSQGGTEFLGMMAAVCVWAAGSGLEAAVVGVPAKLLCSTLAYAGTVSAAPLLLLFSLAYFRSGWRPPGRMHAVLWLIPAATLALAATNSMHGLVWSSMTPKPGSTIFIYGHGPWFWVAVAYDALVTLAATAIITWSAMRARGLYARQTLMLLGGVALPWAAVILYLTPANPFPGLELAPIGFAGTGLLLLAALRRFRFLDVIPVARDQLVEMMGDGLVVLDGGGRVVFVNPAAQRLFGVGSAAIGQALEAGIPALAPLLPRLREAGEAAGEMALPGDPPRHLDVRSSVLVGLPGAPSGRLLMVRDLTDRKLLELERERLIAELRGALADIKTLQGLLPICASCKKIRDDRGYWSTLEKYFADHADIRFSHGLCPECLRRLYPDFLGPVSGEQP